MPKEPTKQPASVEQFDVLIIGAGISGIGAACHLVRELPHKKFVILERRKDLGGTWDLFRYPGIRSDSDMNTFGYAFRPWKEARTLSDGPSIKKYLEDTAREFGVYHRIRFGIKVVRAAFSSAESQWTIEAVEEETGNQQKFQAQFVIACTGYYNYDQGYRPNFPGEEKFRGPIIHPQHWPEDLDYTGKRVVVIGSGATAVTLVPAMAEKAAHVTMLQRSPTYIVSIPSRDSFSEMLRRFLPESWVFQLARARNIALQRLIYVLSRSRPAEIKRLIIAAAERHLAGTTDIRHFTPKYNPWDERLCVVPDGDLFKAIKAGRASVVTDHIETFTEKGIRLRSGQELEADIVVTATGLNVEMMGGVTVEVDGKPVPIADRLTYKAVLFEGVPNAAVIFGYTNSSWTLKVDLACEYICRLLRHMEKNRLRMFVAEAPPDERTTETVLGSLSSGYIRRAADKLPRQGKSLLWRVSNDYLSDSVMLRWLPITDSSLKFS